MNKRMVTWKLTTETTSGKTMGRYMQEEIDALSIVKEGCIPMLKGDHYNWKGKKYSSQYDETSS